MKKHACFSLVCWIADKKQEDMLPNPVSVFPMALNSRKPDRNSSQVEFILKKTPPKYCRDDN